MYWVVGTSVNMGDGNEHTVGMIKNELLCYLSNKIDLVAHDILVKICLDFYTNEEIEEAKLLLHNSCPSKVKLCIRRGNKKSEMNLNDMLAVLHEATDMPLYVAHDLSRIPALDMNNIDVTGMSQDIKKLKNDIGNKAISPTVFNELEELKGQMAAIQTQVGELVTCMKANKDAGSYADATRKNLEVSSFEDVQVEVRQTSAAKKNTTVKQTYDNKSSKNNIRSPAKHEGKNSVKTSIKTDSGTAATLQSASASDSSPFVEVRRRKRNKNCVVGTLGNGSNGFASQGQYVSLFISRLKPETSVKSVTDYIKSSFQVDMKCEKLKTKYEGYSSFKVEGLCDDRSIFFNAEKWPKSTLVRRFFNHKQ